MLAAIADRVVAPGARLTVRPADVGLVDAVDGYLAEGPGLVQWGVRALLRLFDLLAVVSVWGFHRFTALPPDRQDRYMETWVSSRLYGKRAAFRMLLVLLYVQFYNDPRVAEQLGHQGDR